MNQITCQSCPLAARTLSKSVCTCAILCCARRSTFPRQTCSQTPSPLQAVSATSLLSCRHFCQVLNKQVVTRTSGRSLGTISGAWLDPARGTLVSFDLDDRRPGSGSGLALSSPARAGNIPLSALRQVHHRLLYVRCASHLSFVESKCNGSSVQLAAGQLCRRLTVQGCVHMASVLQITPVSVCRAV
jgi:hypothetical protein